MNIPAPICHKLAYSKRLVALLDSEIDWYLNEKSEDMIREGYKNPSEFAAMIQGREIPVIIPLICGDALQNIRSTLDYLVWELVLANKDKPDEANAFPVCKDPASFSDAKKRRLRGIHADAVALIESMQPYTFGKGNEEQSFLFVLDKLANIQKHRSILIAKERHAPTSTIGVRDGSGNIIGFDPSRAPDAQATFDVMKATIETNMNVEMVLFVQFGEGPAKGFEVVSVVSGLYRNLALDVVPQFNRFFA
jgi:hypothetical protein